MTHFIRRVYWAKRKEGIALWAAIIALKTSISVYVKKIQSVGSRLLDKKTICHSSKMPKYPLNVLVLSTNSLDSHKWATVFAVYFLAPCKGSVADYHFESSILFLIYILSGRSWVGLCYRLRSLWPRSEGGKCQGVWGHRYLLIHCLCVFVVYSEFLDEIYFF